MQKKILFLLFIILSSAAVKAQSVQRHIETPQYKMLQDKLAAGWNTWYNNSVISEVLLPECFSINLCVTNRSGPAYLKEILKVSDILKRPEKVILGLRSDDGKYTSLILRYKTDDITIQTATDGGDELILVSPAKPSENYLVAEAGLLWNRGGLIGMAHDRLIGKFGAKTITVRSTEPTIRDGYTVSTAPRFTLALKQEIGLYTGKTRTLSEIKKIIDRGRLEQQKRVDSYGNLAESFKGMQTILAWNTIYDAPNRRVITPVSRLWNYNWGGYVLFDWDTYFASYMFALFDKDLAYANAIEITKAITPEGFIPNYQSIGRGSSLDRSQPPIGSTVILNIYKKYREKWFLNEVYDELLTWNRWWPKNRDVKGYLAWGSYNALDSLGTKGAANHAQGAKYESGLDNSPMYDGVPYNSHTHTLELADVGLMSLYVMDCHSLAEISGILGKYKEENELTERAAFYSRQLASLWDDKAGIYFNKRLDSDETSYRLSPTNFYPMLAKVCSDAQAKRMIAAHYYNPNEFYGKYVMPSIARNDSAFKDNNYWRGRIWGPMNFLVYLGMRNYDLKEARMDLIDKSKDVFLQNWRADGGVYENYNSVNGAGSDVHNADGFYHWGALLTFMEFIEKGYMDPKGCPLSRAHGQRSVLSWKKTPSGLTITTSNGILELTPFINNVLRVQFGSYHNVEAAKSFAVLRGPAAIPFKVTDDKPDLVLSTAGYSAHVSRMTGRVRIFNHSGKLLLEELPGGGRDAVHDDSLMIGDRFQLSDADALYGLGQFRDGAMNLRGKRRELVQMNTQAAVPVLLSTNGWGIFWDNPSRTVFNDDSSGMTFSSDYGRVIRYYVFIGSKLDDLMAGYRNLTGAAPMLPRWAFGYHQSRNKYATQGQVLTVAQRMRKEGIPFSSIFIDYYYWGKYGTGSNQFDETLFPDLRKMMDTLHRDLHVKVIATVWPVFKPGSRNYQEMERHGYLLNGVKALDGVVYDAFNPGAAAQYWKQVATQLVPTGLDGWFLDGPEPDNVSAFPKSMTYLGPAATVRNLFPLFHSTNFYNGLLSLDSNRRPYIITRCAWASQQKNGTVIWSGDIASTFQELKKQIPAGLNFTASGLPYWTTDIGGYSGGNPEDPKYREVFTRWWQYGVFCPIFRSHGRRYPGDTKGPNELWAYGPQTQKICTDFDGFRYRLLPYIYSLAGDVTQENYTPMRLLAFDFPEDKAVWDIKDEFMYGPSLLICPVTDSGAIERKVYLPGGFDWTNFWTGEIQAGGQTIVAAAPIEQLPIFVKCGSILPLGPLQQYVDQYSADALELRVYTGADGQFELYEDDGATYNYKKGQFSRILFEWNERAKTVTIAKRMGTFPGMLKKRTFRIVWVDQQSGLGFSTAHDAVDARYSGEEVIIKRPEVRH